jgi:transcription elongation factor GreB
MKAREGDIVELRTPAGIEQIEVIDVRYSGSAGDQQH